MVLKLGKLQKSLNGQGSSPELRKAATDISTEGRRIIRDEIQSTFKDRTGALSKSWTKKTHRPTKGVLLRVTWQSKSPYAKIQDKGGTIVPRKRRFLTVPIHPMAKRRSLLTFAGTFVRNGIVYKKVGKGSVIALYSLQKSVTIKGTRYLRKSGKKIRKYAKARITQAVRELVQGAIGK